MTPLRKEIIGNATLYLGDCLEILPTLGKVDAVITDPPYLISFSTGGKSDTEQGKKWSGILKPCDVSVGIHQTDISKWLSIISYDVELYIFCNDKNVFKVLQEADKCGLRTHNILVWKKQNATPNRWYMKNCEFVAYFWRGRAKAIKNMGSKQCIEVQGVENRQHPTEKPIELMEHFVKNAGEEILDPFMGSGTTGVACMNLGRKFIGIEIEPKYFEIACERIDNAQKQGRLFV
jgi:site-specific DNA-methyltransferase (adenine-specific)